jgi:hypothetical protein
MEKVELLIGILIVLIIYLLYQCWNKSHKKKDCKNKDTKKEGIMSGPGPENVKDLNDGSRPEHQFSQFGSGPLNRQLYAQYKDLKNLTKFNDYNQVMQYEALEPEVFASQNAYANGINRTTSGASAMTVRTDNNDVVPWVGLKRPDYHDVGPGYGARVDTSEYADQMPRFTRYLV